MGTASCCLIPQTPLSNSDWIDIASVIVNTIAIAVNAALAYWIVQTIQNKLTNKRVLKDYFISELKEIRNEYKTCLSNLYTNRTYPQNVTPWFKLMNIKVADLMDILHDKYGVDKNLLQPYQIDLRELVTNNQEFIVQYRNTNPVQFSDASKTAFIKFQQDHNRLFNDIIIKVNDHE